MRRTAVITFAIVLMAAVSAWAGDAPRMAILDVQRVVDQSDKGRQVSDDVKEFSEKKREEVEKKIAEREKKLKDLQKQIQSGVMSEPAAQKKVEEFEKYAAEVDEFARDTENEARKYANKRKMEVITSLDSIIDSIGKERGYDIIFRYENVVFTSDSIPDITEDVIVEYDSPKGSGKKK